MSEETKIILPKTFKKNQNQTVFGKSRIVTIQLDSM